jgi:hypothetical protein
MLSKDTDTDSSGASVSESQEDEIDDSDRSEEDKDVMEDAQKEESKYTLEFSNSKPPELQCNICKKNFSAKNNLERHINSIHSTPKFTCVKCKKLFSRQDKLNDHSKRCKS